MTEKGITARFAEGIAKPDRWRCCASRVQTLPATVLDVLADPEIVQGRDEAVLPDGWVRTPGEPLTQTHDEFVEQLMRERGM